MIIDYAEKYYNTLYKVVYLVNKTKVRLAASTDDYYEAHAFARKLRYSKSCTLLAWPLER